VCRPWRDNECVIACDRCSSGARSCDVQHVVVSEGVEAVCSSMKSLCLHQKAECDVVQTV